MRRSARAHSLGVWMNGEYVGRWSAAGSVLQYADSWLESPNTRPISLSLPLTSSPYKGAKVSAYFENLLPDSPVILERLARRFRTSTGTFDLLAEIGRDCAGALQLLPAGESPQEVQSIQREPLTETQVETLLTQVQLPDVLGMHGEEEDFRISIAGAQEKTALLYQDGQWYRPLGATPTTHILKLPLGRVGNLGLDLQTSVENEWLCAQILAGCGIPTASCALATFGTQKALVVERFDRRLSGDGRWILRLPQEDFCQVTGTPPIRKYEVDGGPGMRQILDLLRYSRFAGADRVTFLKAQILFWLLRASDGHAKNFSIRLEAGGTFRLTPLYDVLSAYPLLGPGVGQISAQKIKLAMAVRGTHVHWRMQEIQKRHWVEFAAKSGMGGEIDNIFAEILRDLPGILETIAGTLPDDFPAAVAGPILDGVQTALRALAHA